MRHPQPLTTAAPIDTGLAHNVRTLVSQAMAMRELYANVASGSARCAATRTGRAAIRHSQDRIRGSINR